MQSKQSYNFLSLKEQTKGQIVAQLPVAGRYPTPMLRKMAAPSEFLSDFSKFGTKILRKRFRTGVFETSRFYSPPLMLHIQGVSIP